MAIFKLCPDDELVNTLHTVFMANIVRIPEARLRPLTVIASSDEKPHFWGYLNELTESDIPDVQSYIQESPMADISGKRSKSVNADIGLQILQGFLSGFSLPSAAIAAKFSFAKKVSFSFQEVIRFYISPSQIGKLLQGHALDAGNGSNNIFLRKEAQLLLVDSVITSKDFSINVEMSSAKDFSLDIASIQQIVGQVKPAVQLASSSASDITFKGETPLAFAFTCLHCELDDGGRIILKPSSVATHFDVQSSSEHQLIVEEPAMIEFQQRSRKF